jgi:hypothetical protein
VGLLFSRLFVRKQDDADDMVLEARLDALEKQEDE